MATTEKLFSYGTLREEAVQHATFGRRLQGKPDAVTGYTLSMIAIRDAHVVSLSNADSHPILTPSGNSADIVEGVVFDVTPEELAHADAYEVKDYTRVEVVLRSGTRAWVYVSANA